MPHLLRSPPQAGPAVTLTVAAYGSVRATAEEVAVLRQCPGPPVAQASAPSNLKHADDQTVAALAAVFQAAHNFGLSEASFTDWGVLAAPRFLGRAAMAAALQRFALEGAWGVSPHLIPHRSTHAVSGTISQALGIHGPNFGVGGGPESACEIMMAAATLLASENVPGLWVVLTGIEPEPFLDADGKPLANGHPAGNAAQAVALALRGPASGAAGIRLRVGLGHCPRSEHRLWRPRKWPTLHLDGLLHALQKRPARAHWRLGYRGWLEIDGLSADAENRL